ncbi:MAG: hypothetical protein QNJ72_42585 [Pleurocapsa sp. MO_226.B13]|nr:hypothetical protein [Pleurocapsa sp. MO_226.B13]
MNTTRQTQSATDKTTIQQLTEQWRDIWSPKDRTFTGRGLKLAIALVPFLLLLPK